MTGPGDKKQPELRSMGLFSVRNKQQFSTNLSRFHAVIMLKNERDHPGFRSLQICADSKKNRQTQKHNKNPTAISKRIIIFFKTGEKSHLCETDETFYCSNLYRSVEITDLYTSLQSQTMTNKLL